MPKRKAFPREIYLKLETYPNDDPDFEYYEDAKQIAQPDTKIEVGVYQFVGTAIVTAPVSVQSGTPSAGRRLIAKSGS